MESGAADGTEVGELRLLSGTMHQYNKNVLQRKGNTERGKDGEREELELEVPSSHQLNLIRHSVYTKMQATLCSHLPSSPLPLPLSARSSLCLRVDAQNIEEASQAAGMGGTGLLPRLAIVVCLLPIRRVDYVDDDDDDDDDGFWFSSLVKYSSNFPIEIIKQFAFHLKIALK